MTIFSEKVDEDEVFYYKDYYYIYIYPGYPRHRSVFQWGPAL
jgi:hypothetical protein